MIDKESNDLAHCPDRWLASQECSRILDKMQIYPINFAMTIAST